MIWWIAVLISASLTLILCRLYEGKIRDLERTIEQLKHEKAQLEKQSQGKDPAGFWYE